MNSVKTAVLLASLTGLLLFIGGLVGGSNGLIIMFVISMVINFVSYWNSDKIVLSMYNAQPVSENDAHGLYAIVRKLAKAGQLPMPKVYIIQSDAPNAFATGRNPAHAAVAITTSLLSMLTPDEVEGVLGHEMTHIKHRDTLIQTVAATIAGVISMIANMLQMFAIFGGRSDDREGNGNVFVLLATAILAPMMAALIQMAISRSREYMADEGGAALSGKPMALASALAKIDYYARNGRLPEVSESQAEATAHLFIINPLSGLSGGLSSLFSTHPKTEDRIARLKIIAQKNQ